MQIFYPKTKRDARKNKSEEVIEIGDFRFTKQVPETEANSESFWFNNANYLYFVAAFIVIMAFMKITNAPQWVAFVLAIPVVVLYVMVIAPNLPSRLVGISLDEEAHYLMLARKAKTFFGIVTRAEYLDIHEIENISEGLIQLKKGKTRKLAEIDSQMASNMNTAISEIIAKSGGIPPQIRRQKMVVLDYSSED